MWTISLVQLRDGQEAESELNHPLLNYRPVLKAIVTLKSYYRILLSYLNRQKHSSQSALLPSDPSHVAPVLIPHGTFHHQHTCRSSQASMCPSARPNTDVRPLWPGAWRFVYERHQHSSQWGAGTSGDHLLPFGVKAFVVVIIIIKSHQVSD